VCVHAHVCVSRCAPLQHMPLVVSHSWSAMPLVVSHAATRGQPCHSWSAMRPLVVSHAATRGQPCGHSWSAHATRGQPCGICSSPLLVTRSVVSTAHGRPRTIRLVVCMGCVPRPTAQPAGPAPVLNAGTARAEPAPSTPPPYPSLLDPGEQLPEGGLAAQLGHVGGPQDLYALPDFRHMRSEAKVGWFLPGLPPDMVQLAIACRRSQTAWRVSSTAGCECRRAKGSTLFWSTLPAVLRGVASNACLLHCLPGVPG